MSSSSSQFQDDFIANSDLLSESEQTQIIDTIYATYPLHEEDQIFADFCDITIQCNIAKKSVERTDQEYQMLSNKHSELSELLDIALKNATTNAYGKSMYDLETENARLCNYIKLLEQSNAANMQLGNFQRENYRFAILKEVAATPVNIDQIKLDTHNEIMGAYAEHQINIQERINALKNAQGVSIPPINNDAMWSSIMHVLKDDFNYTDIFKRGEDVIFDEFNRISASRVSAPIAVTIVTPVISTTALTPVIKSTASSSRRAKPKVIKAQKRPTVTESKKDTPPLQAIVINMTPMKKGILPPPPPPPQAQKPDIVKETPVATPIASKSAAAAPVKLSFLEEIKNFKLSRVLHTPKPLRTVAPVAARELTLEESLKREFTSMGNMSKSSSASEENGDAWE